MTCTARRSTHEWPAPVHVPVIYQDGQFTPAPYVQIYFPKEQIAELTGALTT